MEINCNLDNIKEFVSSDKFTSFLVNNTTDIGTAAFVLQTLLDRIEKIEKGEE